MDEVGKGEEGTMLGVRKYFSNYSNH